MSIPILTPDLIPEGVRALLAREATTTTRVAIVGATNDRSKYGNIILRDLVCKGFMVLPVNPATLVVEGLKTFTSVQEIEGAIDVVNFVVPPRVSSEALETIDPARVQVLWFQPGAFDREVVERACSRFERVIAGPCIMVET